MIFTIVCALVLLDEAEAYTLSGLLWILFTVALMIAGIQVIAWKTNVLAEGAADKATDDENEAEAKAASCGKMATNSPIKRSGLLYQDKRDAHTKFLLKLFTYDGNQSDLKEHKRTNDQS